MMRSYQDEKKLPLNKVRYVDKKRLATKLLGRPTTPEVIIGSGLEVKGTLAFRRYAQINGKFNGRLVPKFDNQDGVDKLLLCIGRDGEVRLYVVHFHLYSNPMYISRRDVIFVSVLCLFCD